MTTGWHTSCKGHSPAFRDACSWAVLLGVNEKVNTRVTIMNKSNQTILSTFTNFAKLWAIAGSLAWTCVANAEHANSVPGRILVKARDGITESELQQLFAAHGAQQHSAIHQINVRILNVPEAARDHVLDALQHHASIEFAEPDSIHEPSLVPNDTYYSSAWHLPKIEVPQAWDITTGSSSVIIAILDKGVDGTHPDLAAKIVSGWNFYDNNSDTSDVVGHGTLVAGAAAAMSDNGIGVTSLAWSCRIMPVRISDTTGSAYDSTAAQALTWAADHGARVANISYALSQSSAVTTAAQYFQSKGGVVTVAAGNYSTFVAASDNPYVLTISATDSSDVLGSFSNTGNNIDLAAPGVNIATTVRGGSYGISSGTSLSAPVVAGVAALVISANPGLAGSQVQDILKNTTDDLGAPGWDPSYGWGRVNAYKAVLAAKGATPPTSDTTPPTASISAPTGGTTVSGTVSVTVASSDNVGVSKVELYANGTLAGTSTTGSFSWNTTTRTNGSCNLQARAYDAAGNSASSAQVNITVQNTVTDTTAPTATITAPAAGSTVSGVVSVNVGATDNVGVTRVEWYLNGTMVSSSASATATFFWNTATCPNGSCTLQAKAYDAAGNLGSSSLMTVSVNNAPPSSDLVAPSVQITSPPSGARVVKTTKVYVTATDNVAVTRVDLVVDSKVYSTSTMVNPVFSWNTSKIFSGAHALQAVAYDAAGNVTRSTVVTVNK